MTPDQQSAIDKARTSARILKQHAQRARELGLTVLEQWLRDASVGCQAGADFQARALGDNLTTQTERVVVDSKPNPKTAKLVEGPAGPIYDTTDQADAIAEAIKRKGLIK